MVAGRTSARSLTSARSSAQGQTTSRQLLSDRPEWDHAPLRHAPQALQGLRPRTREAWSEGARADLALRMDFGSRSDLGLGPLGSPYNGLVENAKARRTENAQAQPWDTTPVRHMPPSLRGQKTLRRVEPWSQFHNDNIEELNCMLSLAR